MSLPVAHDLGNWIGAFLWRFQTAACRITRRNVDLCFPDRPAEDRTALAQQSVAETVKSALELGKIWLSPVDDVLRMIHGVKGEALLDAAIARGKGLIVLAPHLGNWEVCGLYLRRRFPCTFLYKPPKLAAFEKTMLQYRGRIGAQLAPTSPKGIAMLLKALGKGEVVGILPDQEPSLESGVFAPFFGVKALTMTLVGKLQRKTDAAVVMVYARRLANGAGFEIVVEPPQDDIAHEDPVIAAAALNASVEACVHQAEHQYQWEYKRFKHQPDHSKNALYR